MEHRFTVPPQEAGERIDTWLTKKLGHYSRKQIKALLDGGRIIVNRRRVLIAGWELEPDDNIEVRIPPGFDKRPEGAEAPTPKAPREQASPLKHEHGERVSTSIDRFLERSKDRRQRADEAARAERENSKGKAPGGRPKGRGDRAKEKGQGEGRQKGREWLHVYHEDRDIIVVEKPAGILSIPPKREEGKPQEARGGRRSRRNSRDTLLAQVQRYVRRRHPDAKGVFVSPLHRLDVETSGIMVFALSNAGKRLSRQFREHTIVREYTAVVGGRLEKEQGVIDRPLEKGKYAGGRKTREAESGEGQRAVTEWRVKERYGDATQLIVRVRTGRTHQIRVHLAGEGHPVVGDTTYGEGGRKMAFRRHALHAHTLSFKHPSGSAKLNFNSPLPEDMVKLIDDLREGK